jgi:hypothetical protein
MRLPTPRLAALLVLALAAPACSSSGGQTPSPAAQAPGEAAPAEPKRPAFLVYEQKGRRLTVDAFGKPVETAVRQKVLASATALRTENLDGGGVEIVRLDRKVMWRLDPAKKTYQQATFGELAAQVENIKAFLRRRLKDKDLPAAEKRALLVALGEARPKVTVEADAETVEMLGRRCRHVRYLEDGVLRVEQWLTEDLASPADLGEVRALTGNVSAELLAKFAARHGFSLRTRVLGRLPAVQPRLAEQEVTALETPEKLDPGLFEIPQGYTRAESGADRR